MRKSALLAVVFLAGGCLLVRDLDTLGGPSVRSSDGGTEVGTSTESGSPPANDDGGTEACLRVAGPAMVRVTSYCIDATEVSVGHYRSFLNARAADTSGQRASCSWNTEFQPKGGMLDTSADQFPMTNIDFCDAVAFCEWAGKRLCGAIGGGPNAMSELANPTRSQWFRACSLAGTRDYPYGGYEPDRCNGLDKEAGALLPVGSQPQCVGGYDGLFDLSGNTREWEDACDDSPGETRQCLVRGGAFYDINFTLGCSNRQAVAINSRDVGYGFRCCAP